jgi:hypothetical protein
MEFNVCCSYTPVLEIGGTPPPFRPRDAAPLTPEQEKVAAELSGTFSPEDLRNAFRATGSADRDRVIEWILATPEEREDAASEPEVTDEMLWSEVEWIIADRPQDRMPIGIEPIVRPRVTRPAPGTDDAERRAAAPDKRAEWAQISSGIAVRRGQQTAARGSAPVQATVKSRQAIGGPFQIRFRLDRAALTENFEETVTVGDVIARLREKAGVNNVKLAIVGPPTVTLTVEDAHRKLADCVADRRFACTIVPV